MALCTVKRVVVGYPEEYNGTKDMTTIDCEIDTGTFVRVGYATSEVDTQAKVQSKLEADSAQLLDFEENGSRDADFTVPSYGTVDEALKPAPFNI